MRVRPLSLHRLTLQFTHSEFSDSESFKFIPILLDADVVAVRLKFLKSDIFPASLYNLFLHTTYYST